MSSELSSLGRNLNIMLFDNRKTQRELAAEVGVSSQMISDIIYGKKAPSAETLIKIARALNVKVDDLIKKA